jgi:MtfA peptidase
MILGLTFLVLLGLGLWMFRAYWCKGALVKGKDPPLSKEAKDLLWQNVRYYRSLGKADRLIFEKRVHEFLKNTSIVGVGLQVKPLDKLLVAASAIIPVMGIAAFYAYPNIKEVLLYPDRFHPDSFSLEGENRNALGMVGGGSLENKMILSRPALYLGFTAGGKENVGIHEFVHLIDKADGYADGIPEALLHNQCSIPWLEAMRQTMEKMELGKGDISRYALTNKAEFFAVTAEYFFQRPKQFRRLHPRLYKQLSKVFRQKL